VRERLCSRNQFLSSLEPLLWCALQLYIDAIHRHGTVRIKTASGWPCTCKHSKTSLADERVDDVAEEIEPAAIALHSHVELIHTLPFYDGLTDEAQTDETEQDTAHKVGQNSRCSGVHDRLEPAQQEI
jgi:hypothetical protein